MFAQACPNIGLGLGCVRPTHPSCTPICFLTLDHVGYMYTIPKLSRFAIVDIYDNENHDMLEI